MATAINSIKTQYAHPFRATLESPDFCFSPRWNNARMTEGYNELCDTQFTNLDECMSHYAKLDECFTPQTANVVELPTAEAIVAQPTETPTDDKGTDETAHPQERAAVKPTDIVLKDDQKGSDIVKPVRGAIKQAIFTIFQDVVDNGTPATKENVSIFIRAVEKQMPERKGMGANGNLFAEFRGEPYQKSNDGTPRVTAQKSKFTEPKMPVMDMPKFMALMATGEHTAYMNEMTAAAEQYQKDLAQYKLDIENEKAEAQKAQAAKLDNKVTSLCGDLVKIFGNAETAQTEAFSLITAYFSALTVATTEA